MRNRKPCPCCKLVSSSRAADDICHQCRRLYDLGQQENERRLAKKGEVLNIPPRDMPHWLPSLPVYVNARDALQKALSSLIWAISTDPATGEHPSYSKPIQRPESLFAEVNGFGNYVLRKFPLGSQSAFRALLISIRQALQASYEEGRRDGRAVLLEMASGNLTIDEINKEALRK